MRSRCRTPRTRVFQGVQSVLPRQDALNTLFPKGGVGSCGRPGEGECRTHSAASGRNQKGLLFHDPLLWQNGS